MGVPSSPNALQFSFHSSASVLSSWGVKLVSRTQTKDTQCYSRVKGYKINQQAVGKVSNITIIKKYIFFGDQK